MNEWTCRCHSSEKVVCDAVSPIFPFLYPPNTCSPQPFAPKHRIRIRDGKRKKSQPMICRPPAGPGGRVKLRLPPGCPVEADYPRSGSGDCTDTLPMYRVCLEYSCSYSLFPFFGRTSVTLRSSEKSANAIRSSWLLVLSLLGVCSGRGLGV